MHWFCKRDIQRWISKALESLEQMKLQQFQSGDKGNRRVPSQFPPVLVLALLPVLFASVEFMAPLSLRAQEEQTEGTSGSVDDELESRIRSLVEKGMADGEMPGAVILVGCREGILFQEAYGHRQLEPAKEKMTLDTVFDLASITKPVATATSIMILADQGKLSLQAPVTRYLPEFDNQGKSEVTLHQLLLHEGGLIADNSIRDYQGDRSKCIENVMNLPLHYEPGTRFVYSDVGFIVLGTVVERVSGMTLDQFTKQHLFTPLAMASTSFNPPNSWQSRISPTEKRENEWIRGIVHDPRSFAMDGVAGHAGLFSSAENLAKYCQAMMIDEGHQSSLGLKPKTIQEMTVGREVPRGLRGYGWDKQSPYSSNRSPLYSESAFGHGGFTGTSLWIDPDNDLFVIFLSSRLHPDGTGSVNRIAASVGTVAMEMLRPAPSSNSKD